VNKIGLSRNAIVFQLGQLEADGLIERERFVHSNRAGKPAIQYKAVDGKEDSLSKAYPAFSSLLIKKMSEELTASKMKSILRKVGQDLALDLNIDENLPVEERLRIAREFADSMGAATEITTQKNKIIIESHNCPLAAAVRADPCVCSVIASLFSNSTGCKVKELCKRSNEKLLCRFSIHNVRG
jgi:predicted ArsR family transcriptional regulator